MKNNKDWTGGNKSIYTCHGASSHSEGEREENDYYATDPNTILDLIHFEEFTPTEDNDYFQDNTNFRVWEPSCGEGHLSKELEKHGFSVISSDLIDRGYGTGGINFLECNKPFNGHIITNPPYKYAREFVEKSLELIPDGKKVAMFLKLTFLEGIARKKFFKEYPVKTVYVYSKRQMCAKNGEFEKYKSNAVAYCWFVWEKGFKGDTIIKRI